MMYHVIYNTRSFSTRAIRNNFIIE